MQNGKGWLLCLLEDWMDLIRSECGQCSVLTNPAGLTAALLPSRLSGQWYFVFVSLSFSLWLIEVYKKNFGILFLTVARVPGWMWSSASRHACPEGPSARHWWCLLLWAVLLGTLWNSAGTDGKSYLWHAWTPFNATGWRLPDWRATLWKRSWRVSRLEGPGGLHLWGEVEGPGLENTQLQRVWQQTTRTCGDVIGPSQWCRAENARQQV